MSEVQWGLLGHFPNPGQAFTDGFQQGQQRRREQEKDRALQALAANPQDPKALQQYARFDARGAMEMGQRQQETLAKQAEARRENIIAGAQIIRQIRPNDDATWQQALGMARQMGIDVTGVPTNFDQSYVNNMVSLADAFEPQKQEGSQADIQKYEYAKAQGFTGSFMDFLDSQKGPMAVQGFDAQGNPTVTFVPRTQVASQSGPQPGMVEDGYRFKGGNPADPNSWEPVNGGPTASQSGGFPASGN